MKCKMYNTKRTAKKARKTGQRIMKKGKRYYLKKYKK